MKLESKEQNYELEDHPFRYIPYVTLSEAWAELKGGAALFGCFGLLIIGSGVMDHMGSAFMADRGIKFPDLPVWAWFMGAWMLATWFGRGETVNFRIPHLTFRTWAAICILTFGPFALFSILPRLVVALMVYTNFSVLAVLSSLGRKGYENFISQRGVEK